jgi:hypothetical protein
VPVPCFLLFLCFRKVTQEIFSELDETKPEPPILPNLLDNASQVNESIERINKRITILEASIIHDNQNLRIGKLEESMETLSSIFYSLKFKREKAFVGKEQTFIYISKVSIPKPHNVLKIDKTFSANKSDLHVESSSVPIVTSCALKEVINVDVSSLENT